MLNYKGRLWQDVIRSKYGYVGQGGESGMRGGNFMKGSIWWQDLGSIDQNDNAYCNWFSNGIVKLVGNGSHTLFWYDLWADGVPLSVKYCRLYSISSGKHSEIKHLGKWSGSNWVWEFPWRRRLFAWEEDLLEQLKADIQHVHLSQIGQDS